MGISSKHMSIFKGHYPILAYRSWYTLDFMPISVGCFGVDIAIFENIRYLSFRHFWGSRPNEQTFGVQTPPIHVYNEKYNLLEDTMLGLGLAPINFDIPVNYT